MAGNLIFRSRARRGGFCLLALLGAATAACAETLPDPTRPAFELIPVSSVTGAAATAPALSAGLQSVILSSHKKAAIINGQEILLGEKVGEAKLVEINETCVVLMGAQGRQVLQMFPSVTTNKNEGACSKKTLPELMPAQSAASASGARLAKMKHRKRKSAKPAATCVAPANNEGSGK